MNFWNIFLFPFAALYGLITKVRNYGYDQHFLKSYKIPGKSIVIGNLSMGGTGKSPHTLYIWKLLRDEFKVDFLSRGYGRKTKGLLEVSENHIGTEVGDEPLMFQKRVESKSIVVVSENRKKGVEYIRAKNKDSIILLDDAFQHRKVTAGYSILLTDYSRPFYEDFVVPAGTLRESRKGKKRADCIIVTKCPKDIQESEKQTIIKKIRGNKPVFFSHIEYGNLTSFSSVQTSNFSKILLVTGIANPTPLYEFLSEQYQVELVRFKDHHNFSAKDIEIIHGKFTKFAPNEDGIIVTTEKDFVRLTQKEFEQAIQRYPWYYQPITIKLDKEEEFKNELLKYVRTI